jgi:ACS family hexuronate transporter-like MFS transporter
MSIQGSGIAAGNRAGNFRWTVCALLFFATTINYLDRQVLSLLAPSLSQECGWSNTDYANIAAAFQFVYAVALLFAGRIVDRLGTKLAYQLAILVWSLGAIAHAYSLEIGSAVGVMFGAFGLTAAPASVAGFIVARAILALGEAGNFPAAIKTTAEYFPKAERSFATGIFNSGANIGAILAPLTVPVVAALWGWQAAFMWIGAIGFLWMAFWGGLYDEPSRQRRLSKSEFDYIHADTAGEDAAAAATAGTGKARWRDLLRLRQTWAFAIGKFLTDGVWWFFLFWLPKYLAARYHIATTDLVLPLTVLYSMTMVGSIAGGWWPARFMRRGDSVFGARMKAMLRIACFPLVVLLAQPLAGIGYWVPVLLIGEPADHGLGPVPQALRGLGGRHRRPCRRHRRRPDDQAGRRAVRPLRRARRNRDRLHDHVRDLRHGLPGGLGGDAPAGPGRQGRRAACGNRQSGLD